MWSANLDKVIKNEGNVVATVTFTSDLGEEIVYNIPGNNLTPEILAAHVGNTIQALETRDLAFETLTVGPITPPEKTVEQVAQLESLDTLAKQVKGVQPAIVTP